MRIAPFTATIILAIVLGYGVAWAFPPAGINPDPNHTHADFAVWIGGVRLDFSGDAYMSSPPAHASFWLIPSAQAHGDVDDGHVVPGREYLHVHDGIGNVIHRHKPGLTLGEFFTSIDFAMTAECLTVDEFQFGLLDPSWVEDFARTKTLCNDGKFHWTFVVNGEVRTMDPAFVFNDGDAILLSYGASDTAWQEEWKQMTSDACLYSQTCPWRGKPPAENCIADPTVPCVQ